MKYMYWSLNLDEGDFIRVKLNHPANIRLLTPSNYRQYHRGNTFRYYGGYVDYEPYKIEPPYSGDWYLVIDLKDCASDSVKASVSVFNRDETVINTIEDNQADSDSTPASLKGFQEQLCTEHNEPAIIRHDCGLYLCSTCLSKYECCPECQKQL